MVSAAAMHIKNGLRLIGAAVTVVAFLDVVACASDKKDDAPRGAGGKTGAANQDAGIFGELGIQRPGTKTDDGTSTPSPFEYDKVKSPYDDAAGCKDFSSADVPKGDHADTRACLCDNCFMLMQECDAL